MQNKQGIYENILDKAASDIVLALCQIEQPNEQALKKIIHNLVSNVHPNNDMSVLQATKDAVDAYTEFYKLVQGIKLDPKDISYNPETEGLLSIQYVCKFVKTVLKETGTQHTLNDPKALDDSHANQYNPEITGPLIVVHDLLSYVYELMNGLAFTSQ